MSWNFYYWPTKGDAIHEPWAGGNGRVDTPRAWGDDVQVASFGSYIPPGQDIILPGPNGLLETPVAAGDDSTWFPNLYDDLTFRGADGTMFATPSPLLKYDQIFGTNARAYEASHTQNQDINRWPGHCLGAAIASIKLAEPRPVAGLDMTVDEIKSLWAELGENHLNHTIGDNANNIPAGPPRPRLRPDRRLRPPVPRHAGDPPPGPQAGPPGEPPRLPPERQVQRGLEPRRRQVHREVPRHPRQGGPRREAGGRGREQLGLEPQQQRQQAPDQHLRIHARVRPERRGGRGAGEPVGLDRRRRRGDVRAPEPDGSQRQPMVGTQPEHQRGERPVARRGQRRVGLRPCGQRPRRPGGRWGTTRSAGSPTPPARGSSAEPARRRPTTPRPGGPASSGCSAVADRRSRNRESHGLLVGCGGSSIGDPLGTHQEPSRWRPGTRSASMHRQPTPTVSDSQPTPTVNRPRQFPTVNRPRRFPTWADAARSVDLADRRAAASRYSSRTPLFGPDHRRSHGTRPTLPPKGRCLRNPRDRRAPTRRNEPNFLRNEPNFLESRQFRKYGRPISRQYATFGACPGDETKPISPREPSPVHRVRPFSALWIRRRTRPLGSIGENS